MQQPTTNHLSGPGKRLAAQAEHCRRTWALLTEQKRSQLCRRLEAENSPFSAVWVQILERRHPFASWLEGTAPFEDLPADYEAGPSPRQIISSHPFTDVHPWFNLPMSREFSSMPQG